MRELIMEPIYGPTAKEAPFREIAGGQIVDRFGYLVCQINLERLTTGEAVVITKAVLSGLNEIEGKIE
jgi:hypothetical protein